MRATIRRFIVVTGLALTLSVAPFLPISSESPAMGAPVVIPERAAAKKTFDRKFSAKVVRFVPALDRCVRMRVSGRIKGTRTYSGRGGTTTTWSNVRILRPKVRATILDYYVAPQGAGCADRARVKKIAIKQEWKQKTCSVKISGISVGFPWAIGAGFGCSGNDRVARRKSTDGAGKFAVQANSDAIISYAHVSYVSRQSFVASVRMSVRIHRKMGGGWRNDQVSGVAHVVLPGN